MEDDGRCMSLIKEAEGVYIDFSRQRVTQETMQVGQCSHPRAACMFTLMQLHAVVPDESVHS